MFSTPKWNELTISATQESFIKFKIEPSISLVINFYSFAPGRLFRPRPTNPRLLMKFRAEMQRLPIFRYSIKLYRPNQMTRGPKFDHLEGYSFRTSPWAFLCRSRISVWTTNSSFSSISLWLPTSCSPTSYPWVSGLRNIYDLILIANNNNIYVVFGSIHPFNRI